MGDERFSRPFSRTTVILFWLIVLAIVVALYFFYPSLFYQVTQVPYQRTPYVNTPMN